MTLAWRARQVRPIVTMSSWRLVVGVCVHRIGSRRYDMARPRLLLISIITDTHILLAP